MFDFNFLAIAGQLALEIAYETLAFGNLRVHANGNLVIAFDLTFQVIQKLLRPVSLNGLFYMSRAAAELVGFLDQVDSEALIGDRKRRRHPGDSPADHEQISFGYVRLSGKRFYRSRPADRHLHQVYRLFLCRLAKPGVDPGALVADVRHLKQVRIEPRLFHGLPEQRLMRSRRTRGHDYFVQLVLFDTLLDSL